MDMLKESVGNMIYLSRTLYIDGQCYGVTLEEDLWKDIGKIENSHTGELQIILKGILSAIRYRVTIALEEIRYTLNVIFHKWL